MSPRADPKSLFAFLYRWLLESDLPVALQVFWKLLTLAMGVVLVYAVTTTDPPMPWFAQAWLYALSAVFFLACLFTKLGDG